MQTFETKNEIKDRILKEAARDWGYRSKTDIDLNAFDPVVDLLIGACSFELERLSNDITNSRNRIFERLVEILTPDIMTKAQPAYTIAHAQPVEAKTVTALQDQFFYKNLDLKKDVFFAPAERFTLYDGRVEAMAYDNRVVKINQRLEKDVLLESTYGQYLAPGTFFIGLKLNEAIRNLENLTFFFDWKNEVRINSFLKYLPLTQWSINGKDIEVKQGHNYKKEYRDAEKEDVLNSLGIEQFIENNILATCRSHFLTINETDFEWQKCRSKYPQELKEIFNETDFARLTEELLWIKVIMPQNLRDHVAEMDCHINCFPIINRKLHEKQDKLLKDMHIYPIGLEDGLFLSMESMTNSNSVAYKEVPIKIIDESDHGMYAIRNRGVRRFDTREAEHLLSYTLDMVKDETAAFRGLNYANLGADLEEMDVVFKRIQKNFNRSKVDVENTTFLFIRPYQNDDLIFLKYWTTNGSIANRIPHGTPLNLFSNSDLQAKTIQLVTASKGGRDQLQAVDSINAFKEVVMTRGRLVTKEDIKNFCINALGFRNIESIEIRRGVMVSEYENEGLIRTIDVHLRKRPQTQLSEQDWQILCNEVETKLGNKAASAYPIRILNQ